MDKGIKLFSNGEFGTVRTFMQDNEPWLVGKDVAEILGYQNPSKALSDHVDDEDKLNNETLSSLGQRGGWLINESGLYSLVIGSKLPTAKKFRRWITSEVLPTLRKTGSYTIKKEGNEYAIQRMKAEAMLLNAKTRSAKMWVQLATLAGNTPEFQKVATVYATNTLAGDRVMELPEAKEKTYSATEIGEILGVSAVKVGKIANDNGLKTEQYGRLFYDKAKNSTKQVETFRYFESAIPAFQSAIKAVKQ